MLYNDLRTPMPGLHRCKGGVPLPNGKAARATINGKNAGFDEHTEAPAQRFELSVRDIQSSPSYKPSPDVAQAAWRNHFRLRMLYKSSFSVTSAVVIESGRSCLLAKTSSTPM